MQYTPLASCPGTNNTFNGSGWAEDGRGVGQVIHNPSEWSSPPPTCPHVVGDPKVISDDIANNGAGFGDGLVFMTQLCTVNQPGVPPLSGGADGLYIARSLDRAHTFQSGTGYICQICGPTGGINDNCSSAGTYAQGSVDAPDLYFDYEDDWIVAAWHGGSSSPNTFFSMYNLQLFASWSCQRWTAPLPAATMVPALQQYNPSITALQINNGGTTRVAIAYATPNGANFDIDVAYSDWIDPNQDAIKNPPPSWSQVNVDTVAAQATVDAGLIAQYNGTAPRPKLMHLGANTSGVFLVAYPALVNGVNVIKTRYTANCNGNGAPCTWADVPGLQSSSSDRFFPNFSYQPYFYHVVMTWYEATGSGPIFVNSSELTGTTTPAWSSLVPVTPQWTPCTMTAGGVHGFYGYYMGASGACATVNGFYSPNNCTSAVLYPTWADSRNGATTEIWRSEITP